MGGMWIGGVGVVAVVVRMEMRMSVAMVVPLTAQMIQMGDMSHRFGLRLQAA